MAPIEVREITPEASRPIRHAVLRPGRPERELVFDGDADPDTLHVGAFAGRELVAVGRVSPEAPPGEHDPRAWRIRGMATLEAHRGAGAGAAVLARLVRHARERGGDQVWCNARIRARAFYERSGFVAEGEEFDVPGIGPHVRMRLRLAPPT